MTFVAAGHAAVAEPTLRRLRSVPRAANTRPPLGPAQKQNIRRRDVSPGGNVSAATNEELPARAANAPEERDPIPFRPKSTPTEGAQTDGSAKVSKYDEMGPAVPKASAKAGPGTAGAASSVRGARPHAPPLKDGEDADRFPP